MTEDVNIILNKLADYAPEIISGSKDDKIEVIEQADLIRIYANAGKVFAWRHSIIRIISIIQSSLSRCSDQGRIMSR